MIGIVVIGLSCKHDSTVTDLILTDTACDPNTVYFVNDIKPIINSSCAYTGCHDAITHSDGIDLSSYSAIMASGSVKAGSPGNSEMYEKITETDPGDIMPPPPAIALSSDQKNKIRDWISQGAKNNYCDKGCDSTNVGFSASVWPIMQDNCYSCHSGTSAGGGIQITGYQDVRVLVQNGKLVGTINHTAGYSAMPKGGKLSDCEIAIINIWIKNGAQND